MSFAGQTAWITGASSGIGAALARALDQAVQGFERSHRLLKAGGQ